MITTYNDTDADSMYLPANTAWKGGQLHQDDILTTDFAPPNFLATASFDGEIIVWEVDTEKIYVRLRKGQPPNISKKLEALKTRVEGADVRPSSRPTSNSRPNSRHRSSHKVEKGQIPPVDKLLFLKARAGIRFTESAVLISSEAGTLRWWNIYTSHKEMGHFYAPSIQDESVLAMCTKPNDSLLITGDTQGMIRCWDIMGYCTKYEGHITKTPPPIEAVWKAHDSAVVSVEYIQHDAGTFILTASTDKTARLWSPEGHFIGTFGQKTPWNLKMPSTWAHPKTPWSKEDEDRIAAQRDEKSETPVENGTEEYEEGQSDQGLSTREHTELKSATPGMDSRENSFTAPIPQREATPRSATSTLFPPPPPASSLGDLPHSYQFKYRSQTFAFGFHRMERSKTFLGMKVEKDLERRQRDRKGRRVQFGEISPQKTARFGKQCSPYHALTTPDWQEVQLPTDMPLSQRMQNRGYTGKNLTVDYIKAMDFSYGLPDSPPVPRGQTPGIVRGHTPGIVRGHTPGQTLASRQEKGGRLPPIRSSKARHSSYQPSTLKKSSTTL